MYQRTSTLIHNRMKNPPPQFQTSEPPVPHFFDNNLHLTQSSLKNFPANQKGAVIESLQPQLISAVLSGFRELSVDSHSPGRVS